MTEKEIIKWIEENKDQVVSKRKFNAINSEAKEKEIEIEYETVESNYFENSIIVKGYKKRAFPKIMKMSNINE